MKKAYKVLSLLLALVLVFACFAGCASDDGGDANTSNPNSDGEQLSGEGKVIACLCPAISIDYYKQVFYGVIQAAEEKGYEVQIVTGMTSIDDQVATIEDLVEAGIDAIVISPMDSYGIASALDLCKERGVVFISNDEAYGTDTLPDCRIINANYEVGVACAEAFVESLNYEGNVICLRASTGVAVYDEKVEAWESVFAQYDGINVLQIQEAGQDQATAQQTMADLLQQHPDVDGVIAFNEVQLQGAIIALEEAGYELGTDVKLASNNYSTEISSYIESGACSSAIYSWGIMFGMWSVDMIDRVLNGEAIPNYIVQPYSVVDQSNIAEFDALSSVAHDFNFDSYVIS